jgi:protein-disulfide isomerase
MTQIQAMPPGKQFQAIGLAAGFPAIAAAHGIVAARTTACLNNQPRAEQLAKVTDDATNRLKVEGTPTFFVNGTTVDYSNGPTVWGAVEARLAAALRG